MPAMAALLALAMAAACSQVPAASDEGAVLPVEKGSAPSSEKGDRLQLNQSATGRYIVNVSADAEQRINQVFAEYGVHSVHAIGNDLYDFRLSRDPGIEILKNKIESSGGMIKSIQPNYIYHIN